MEQGEDDPGYEACAMRSAGFGPGGPEKNAAHTRLQDRAERIRHPGGLVTMSFSKTYPGLFLLSCQSNFTPRAASSPGMVSCLNASSMVSADTGILLSSHQIRSERKELTSQ